MANNYDLEGFKTKIQSYKTGHSLLSCFDVYDFFSDNSQKLLPKFLLDNMIYIAKYTSYGSTSTNIHKQFCLSGIEYDTENLELKKELEKIVKLIPINLLVNCCVLLTNKTLSFTSTIFWSLS